MPTMRTSARDSGPISPILVLLLILAVVFAVETAIMLLLTGPDATPRGRWTLTLIDSLTLVSFLAPALWILVVRPLRGLVSQRGQLLAKSLTIQEAERARLARDLHDQLGQVQTAILLGLRSISNADSLDLAKQRADYVHDMAVDAVETTRRMARGLSPSVLNDFGLAQAIERICEDLQATTDITLTRDIRLGAARFPPAVEIGAYRVLQEAINNAVKHANAKTIRVQLQLSDAKLLMSVSDDGQGLAASAASPRQSPGASTGLGLGGMRERIVLLGGQFSLSSSPGSGTTLTASLPAVPIPN